MDLLLQALQQLPEFRQLLDTVQSGGAAAATGLAQINRAHVIAGLYDLGDRPLAVICQDDLAAKRPGGTEGLFGPGTPGASGQDLNLYDAAVVSGFGSSAGCGSYTIWGKGQTRLQIFSWESMSLRTMPKSALFAAAFQLRLGVQVSVEELLARLVAMGYSRAPMVEGPGQFALRGNPGPVFPGGGTAGPGGVLWRRVGYHGLLRPQHPTSDGEYGGNYSAACGREPAGPPSRGYSRAAAGPAGAAGPAETAEESE